MPVLDKMLVAENDAENVLKLQYKQSKSEMYHDRNAKERKAFNELMVIN